MKTKLLLKTSMVILMLSAFITKTNAFTAVASGDWSNAATWGGLAPGANVLNQDIIIPSGISVNLDMDVTFTGLLNTFSVDGSLTGTNGLLMDQGSMSGSGMVDISWITFNALSTTSFSGTLTADKIKNAGATLILTAIVNVSDTLNLDAGSILLNAGANVTPMAGSTIRVNNGSMTIGGGVFNTSANYDLVYVGTSKTTGIELNTTMLNNLYVMLNDNAQVLTLGGNIVVNGNMEQPMGTVDLSGRTLTLKGDLLSSAGAMMTTNTTSNIFIEGTNTVSSALAFTAGSAINNLSIDLTGAGAAVMLMTPLNINGNLRLLDGDFNLATGGVLTMNTGSVIHVEDGKMETSGGTFVATAAYNVEYMGASITTNDELSGTGLNNVTVNLLANTDIVTLASPMTVAGTFNLTKGVLMLNNQNLVLNGTMNSTTNGMFSTTTGSDIILNLTSSSGDTLYFAAGANMVDDLVINIAAGSPVVLGSPLEIANQLNFQNGKLNIYNSKLTIQTTGMITGYSDTKYVITAGTGKVEMRVNISAPYVVFPVGTIQNYSPASIQQTGVGTSGNFSVGVVNDVYSGGYTGASVTAGNSLVTKTWFIDAAAAVIVNMNLKLAWMPASEIGGFDRNSAYISHYTTMWDSVAPSTAASASFSTYELTRTNINNLNTSAFAVMDKQVVAGIEELTASNLKLYPNPSSEIVTLDLGTAADLFFEVVDISGKVVMSNAANGSVISFNVSALDKGSYFVRATDVVTKKVITKRFIKG
jgi:hypothetical protein